MAIALQSSGAVAENTSAATTLNVPYPATLNSSSILVLCVCVNNNSVLATLPSGWTQVLRATGTSGTLSPSVMVAIKQATGSETGNLAVTTPSNVSMGGINAFSGVDLTTPQDVTATTIDQSTSSLSTILPTLTTTMAGAALVYAVGHNGSTGNATAPTSPAAFTETHDRVSGTRMGTMGYLVWGSSGSTGAVTVAWSASGKSLGALVALRPAVSTLSGAVAMTETGAMTVAGNFILSGIVAMAATAAMTVAGTATSGSLVTMTETAAMTVAGTVTTTLSGAVAMAETATLTTAGALSYSGAVAMNETSALTPLADVGYDLHTYEEGTNGATIATGNGVIAVLGSPTYATASAMHGTLGVHCASTLQTILYANPAVAGSSGQIYGKVATFSGSQKTALIRFADSSNVTLSAINIGTGGTFIITINGTTYATSTTAVAAGDLFRVDYNAAWNGTTMAITARLFVRSNVEGRSYDQEITATQTQASSPVRVGFGASVASWDLSFDTVRLYSSLTWPGPFNPTITPGTLVHSWSGDPLSDGFVATFKTSGATSLRMAVSTVIGMTSPTWFGPTAPDSDGYTSFTATGLTPATSYYYQVADSPVGGSETLIGTPGSSKTFPVVTTPVGFTVALCSCQTTNSTQSASLDDMVAWNPTFVAHVGDMHYRSSTSLLPADHATGLAAQITGAAGLKNMLSKLPVVYMNSDHEAGPDNGDSNNAWNAAFNTAYRQVVPSRMVDTLPSPVGKYRTWVIGRIRFILIDIRNTDRSPGAAVDDASKTMLGATQKTWLKAQLLQPEPLKVIIADNSWMGTAIGFQWQDKWQSYGTERQELANFITANFVQVDFWHGDSHYVGVDATHNAWGGFPVLCGSPLDNVGSTTDITFFDAAYSSGATPFSNYMRITFTDDGTTITRTASGWDALSGVQRVSQVHTWSSMASANVTMVETSTTTVGAVKSQTAAVAMVETAVVHAGTSSPTAVATIKFRRNTVSGAATSNPVLLSGEPGWNGDALRIGDVAGTAWNLLPQTMMEGPSTVTTVVGNTAVTTTHRVVVGNGSSITVTLAAPSTNGEVGRQVVIKNVHATSLTVATAGATIDGGATVTLAQWAKATFVSDGTQWLTI